MHPQLQSRHRVRPIVETLEDRCLLSATASVSGNVLNIAATKGTDAILIFDNGGNGGNNTTDPAPAHGIKESIQVVVLTATGGTFTQTFNQTFNNNISGVNITLTSGNDIVFYVLTEGTFQNASRNITANLGTGNDFFRMLWGARNTTDQNTMTTFFAGGMEQGSNVALTVFSTSGKKDIGVAATTDMEMAKNTSLLLTLFGGRGDDALTADVNAFADDPSAHLGLFSSGGRGNDTVFDNLNLSGGNTSAQILGGSGDDTLGLLAVFDDAAANANPPNTNPTRITASIFGGGHSNHSIATPNVTVRNTTATTIPLDTLP
jgi:hypothetical protein